MTMMLLSKKKRGNITLDDSDKLAISTSASMSNQEKTLHQRLQKSVRKKEKKSNLRLRIFQVNKYRY